MNNTFGALGWSAIVILLFGTSCITSKKQPISYLGLPGDTTGLSSVSDLDRIIQRGDLINIIVYSDNPMATALYNQALLNPNGISEVQVTNPVAGYLVDRNGNIQFQSIGQIRAAGMTKQKLADTLVGKLKTFLTNPYCSIRLLNYKITVMGEVMKPNSYTIANERVSVLEAIGLAGDISLYGRRDNVKIIREVGSVRQIGMLDLRDPNIFKSEYYFLKQNDIVIIDQLKNKQQASDQVTARNIGILATIVSTFAILFSALRR